MSTGLRRHRLLAIWLLLAVLLAGIIAHETTTIFDFNPPPPTGRLPMFRFGEADLGRVEVVHQGKSGAVMRNAASQWFLHDSAHSHDHHHASAPTHSPHAHDIDREQSNTIAERIALMTRMIADRRIKPERDLSQYGLDNPQTMVAFYGRQDGGAHSTQPLDVLYVGDLLPTQYAYYTRRANDPELSLIPRYYIALLLALVFGEEEAPTPLPVHQNINNR